MSDVTEKVCAKCFRPIDRFGKDGARRRSYCYPCDRLRCAAYRRSENGRITLREKYVRDRDSEKRRASERSRVKKRAQMYPEKMKAKRAVRSAIECGGLVRPSVCQQCGTTPPPMRDGRSPIQAHHDDYSKPLEVRWLCVRCHINEHYDVQEAA